MNNTPNCEYTSSSHSERAFEKNAESHSLREVGIWGTAGCEVRRWTVSRHLLCPWLSQDSPTSHPIDGNVGNEKQRNQAAETDAKFCSIFQKIAQMRMSKWFQRLMASTFVKCYPRTKGHTSAENMILRKYLRNILSLKNVFSLFSPCSLPPDIMLKRLGQSVRKMGTEYNELCYCELEKWKSIHTYSCCMNMEKEEPVHSTHCWNAHTSHTNPAHRQPDINENNSCKQLIYDCQLIESSFLKSPRH